MQSRRANDELQEQLQEERAQGEYDEAHDDDKQFMIKLKSNSAATAGRRKLWKERHNQKRVTFAECTRSRSLGGCPPPTDETIVQTPSYMPDGKGTCSMTNVVSKPIGSTPKYETQYNYCPDPVSSKDAPHVAGNAWRTNMIRAAGSVEEIASLVLL